MSFSSWEEFTENRVLKRAAFTDLSLSEVYAQREEYASRIERVNPFRLPEGFKRAREYGASESCRTAITAESGIAA